MNDITPAEALNKVSRQRIRYLERQRAPQDSEKKTAQRDRWIAVWVKRLMCGHARTLTTKFGGGFNGTFHKCQDCGASAAIKL